MVTYYSKIRISPDLAKKIDYLLSYNPKNETECFGEDETISVTAIFDHGYEVDIKLCGVQFDEREEDNRPWTEAVLFNNGYEITTTEVNNEFFGVWELETEDIKFKILVVRDK